MGADMTPKVDALPYRADPLTRALFRPCRLPLLLAVGFAVGAAHALAMLPLPLILGTSGFWDFPRGTVPGGANDMAQVLVGYTYVVRSPWLLPLLQAPNLGAPTGTNVFWLDAVPLAVLAGKAVFAATGVFVNLLGIFLFLCFALPGVAMTLLLWVAGQRSLPAVLAGAILADATPYLLFEWGHIPLNSQYVLILALALYLAAQRFPADRRVAACWLGLLAVTLLTNTYLFVMVGGCWTAAVVQRAIDHRLKMARLAIEAVTVIALIIGLMLVAGVLNRDLGSAGTTGFGVFSMNLGAPLVPQWSGVIPPLRNYWLGMGSQVFDYMGLGALLVVAAALPSLPRWLRDNARSHVVLICLMVGYYLFALSDRIRLGSHLLVQIPLPEQIAFALGAFRASGRFFWPVGYGVTALAILLVLRNLRPRAALAVLGLASILQLVDVEPIREAIARTARAPAPTVVDRQRLADLLDRSNAVLAFPSFGCVGQNVGLTDTPAILRLSQENMELQLAAARDNLPINSVYNARLNPDCAAEARAERQPLQAGTAYIHMLSFTPDPGQLSGHAAADVCGMIDQVGYCLIPPVFDHRP